MLFFELPKLFKKKIISFFFKTQYLAILFAGRYSVILFLKSSSLKAGAKVVTFFYSTKCFRNYFSSFSLKILLSNYIYLVARFSLESGCKSRYFFPFYQTISAIFYAKKHILQLNTLIFGTLEVEKNSEFYK